MFATRKSLYQQDFRLPLLAIGSLFLLLACVPEKKEGGESGGSGTSTSTNTSTSSLGDIPGRTCTVDRFAQAGGEQVIKKVDILFVMDHSGSMQDDWERVANNMQNLVRELRDDTDVRYAVLLADVGKWSGKLYAPNGYNKVLDNQKMKVQQISSNLHKSFVEGMKVSDSGSGESGFYSLYHSVTTEAVANQKLGFYRPDAALSVIFMSDEQEIGFGFPSHAELKKQGLPVRCDEGFEDGVKRDFYDKKGVNLDAAFNALKRLKGDMPVKTHAFVNLTKQDLFKRNKKNATCLYDSLGYGYFEMVAKTNGVLFSIQENKEVGLARCGQAIRESLELQHDFALSKPADKVDPLTILAVVDGALVAHDYRVASNSVHLENAGKALSQIGIRHCEPDARVNWNLTAFTGTPAQYSVALSWKTAELATLGRIAYGTSASALSQSLADASKATDHVVNVPGLEPNTVYFFQAISSDESGQEKKSEVLSFRTLPDWSISQPISQAARNTASISWNTLEYATKGKVLYGLSADSLNSESEPAAVSMAHQVALSGLVAGTTYFYQVLASDEFGLEKRSDLLSFRTELDWGITGFSGTASRSTAVLAWSTPGLSTTGLVIWGTSPLTLGNPVSDSGSGSSDHTVAVAGLTPDTDYYFQAISVDHLGVEKRSGVILVRTALDWEITGFAGTSTQTSVDLGWTTPGYSTSGRAFWGTSETALTNVVANAAQGSSHNVSVSGLNADTLYYFQAASLDAEGVEKRGAVVAIRTQPVPLPVWSISGASGTSTKDSVTISWSTSAYATSGKVVWGVSPSTLGTEVPEAGNGTSHSVLVTGLAPDTLYYFAAISTDDRGQQQTSEVIAVRTMPDEVVTPPLNWEIVGFDGTTTSSQAFLIWQTPGAATKAVIKVGLSPTDLTHMAVAVEDYNDTHVVAVSGLEPNTTYYFQVITTDTSGKTVESIVITKKTKAP